MTRRFPAGAAYIEGRFCPLSEAKISVLDGGLLHSDATYDVVHLWRRRFFRLDLHIERFLAGIEALKLTLPFGRERLEEILHELAARSGLADAYVEMVLTRGISPTFSRDPRESENNFFAFAIPFVWIANEEQRARGLHLHVSGIARIPPESLDPRIKNYHWLDFVTGLYEAYDADCESVILTDGRGNVTEGPGFNLFQVRGDRVSTPARGVLGGITRRCALELCAELGLQPREAPIAASELASADEIFLTSTAGGILPVTRIDGRTITDGRPGPVTQRLTALYWAKHEDPAWSTPLTMPLREQASQKARSKA
jgi:branched-chain amino acid aminotransferase